MDERLWLKYRGDLIENNDKILFRVYACIMYIVKNRDVSMSERKRYPNPSFPYHMYNTCTYKYYMHS